MIQLKHKLRAPRHPLTEHLDDDEYERRDDTDPSLDAIDEDYLMRDEFNLHKIIVAVTMPGKVVKHNSVKHFCIMRNLHFDGNMFKKY